MNTTNKLMIAGALTGALLLNSCYFNSAGHIFDKASYQASSFTRELRSNNNQVVYTDGSDYYVELTRYRLGEPVVTQYNAFSQNETDSEEKLQERGTDVFRIPSDFAMYLTGQAKGPDVPSEMTLVQNGAAIKSSCSTLPVVRDAGKYAEVWQHRSSAAPWLYAAGVLDWLCVDLPITCVENALLIAGCAAAIGGAMQSSANSYSGGSSSSGDGGSSYSPPSQYEIRSFYHSQGM